MCRCCCSAASHNSRRAPSRHRQFLKQLLAPERKNVCVAAARRVSPELKQLQEQHGADRLLITQLDVADEASVKAWARGLADKVRGGGTHGVHGAVWMML